MNNIRFLSLATILSIGTASVSLAQDYTDALRYSYLSATGTARSMGFGNALGSVGGDFSSLSVNPAGIAIYKSSEVMFTPSLKINSVSGDYLGSSMSNNNTRFNFNNIGVVFTTALKGRRAERSDWKSYSFGVGMNRVADFNHDYTYGGNNYTSSATQAYAADANINHSVGNAGSLGDWGYQSYLTNYDSVAGTYKSIVDPTQGVKQLRSVSERGGINEVVFSFGANYMDQLLLGATIGVPVLNYSRTSSYSEASLTSGTPFNSYTYNESLTTTGTGINVKFGLIYKPTDYIRFGASIHSPTYYTLHDDYGNNLTSNVNNIVYSPSPVNGSYDYNLTTPWRAILSATGFIGTHGFITADYEYVDYSSASFSFHPEDATAQSVSNQQIKTVLGSASNFRVGIEGRITNFFMLRVGYGYMGSPYKNSSGINTSSNTISGGFGFRFDRWYLDAGLAHVMYNGIDQPYPTDASYAAVPVATLKNSFNNASMTLGLKF